MSNDIILNVPEVSDTESVIAREFYINGKGSFDPKTFQPKYTGKNSTKFDDGKHLRKLVNDLKCLQNQKKIQSKEIDVRVIDAMYHHFYKTLVISGQLSIHDLSKPGFWRWFCNIAYDGFFCKFIEWRHPEGDQVNWGIGKFNMKDAYFARILIFRVHYVYISGDDTESITQGTCGTVDSWTSGIIRRNVVRNRNRLHARNEMVYGLNGIDTKMPLGEKSEERDFARAERVWASNHRMDHLSRRNCVDVYRNIRKDTPNLISTV